MPAIKPTVGRVVHFYQHDPMQQDAASRLDAAHGREVAPPKLHRDAQAATVARVINDKLVNLMVISPSGVPQGRENVMLVQDGEAPPKDRSYCAFPPILSAKNEEAPSPVTPKPKPTAPPPSAKPPAQPAAS